MAPSARNYDLEVVKQAPIDASLFLFDVNLAVLC